MADAPGTYSAGTIFLQVVPVFRDVMNEIRSETKGLSDAIGADLEKAGREGGKRAGKAMGEEMEKEAEKSGDNASKKYLGSFEDGIKRSVKSAQRELNSLSFKDSEVGLTEEFRRIKDKLEKIGKVNLEVDFDEKEVLKDIAIIQGAIEALSKKDHDLRFDVNLAEISKSIGQVEKRAEAAAKRRHDLKFGADVDLKPVERKVGAFEKRFREKMKSAADGLGEGVSQQLDVVKAKLETLGDARIGIDLDAGEALAQAAAVRAELQDLAGRDINIQADIDIASALAHLTTLEAAVRGVSATKVKIKTEVDTSQLGLLSTLLSAFKPRANAAGSASDNAANSFRSFNVVILAAVTLLPALIPLIGVLGGALLALVPILGALVAGIGIAVIGFSGIGSAVSELGKVADEQKLAAGQASAASRTLASATNAVADAERGLSDARRNAARAASDAARAIADAERNAARANKDAARAVADARKQAADAIEAAYERQREAAKAYRDAQDEVLQAEQDLRDARKAAADEAASIEDKQRKAAVDERQRVLDLLDAQAKYNAVFADGASTNVDKEQASINLEQAQIALNDVRDTQADLNQQQTDFANNGVDGSQQVQDAQAALTQALEDQKDAQKAVGDAAKDTAEIQLKAAKEIKDALRDQARTAADSARAIADAQRNAARSAADSGRAIADAERNLARARQARNQAVEQAADDATAAEDRLKTAMDKLSPAGRKFARFIFGLRGEAKSLRDGIQEALLPGVQKGLETIIKTYGPQFKKFTRAMAKEVGNIFADAGEGLGGKSWQRFFKTYAPLLPKLLRRFARTLGAWITVFADIFTAVAPYADDFSKVLLQVSRRVEKFFAGKKGQSAIEKFMEYARKYGPLVADFLGKFATAFVDIAKALAPIGVAVLVALTKLFDFIINMDPQTLQILVLAIVTLVVAFQLAVGLTALVAAGAAAFAVPFGTAIVAVAALAVVIAALAIKFKFVRDVLKVAWEKGLRPILQQFRDKWIKVFTETRNFIVNTFIPIVKQIWGVIKELWIKYVQPILGWIRDAWENMVKRFKAAWDGYLFPILDLFIKLVQKLWEKVIKPLLGYIHEKWSDMTGKMDNTWIKHLKPIFDGFIDLMQTYLVPAFQTAIDAIVAIWDGLKSLLAAPVRFVIEKIINEGIIGAFNWVARKVGSKEMATVPIPDWASDSPSTNTNGNHGSGTGPGHAQGTDSVLPGYTPGRDVHQFYSPTAGYLNLSGGEAIMRPEFSAAMGKGGIDQWNNISKRGVGAVRKAMRGQAFAGGGVFWPVPGHETGTYPGHDGVDINRGSGWDDFGDLIRAAHSGTVAYVGSGRGYGDAIWIGGTDGVTTLYGHTSTQYVRAGQSVFGGQPIGRVGNTGNSSAPHLHFGVYPGGTYAAALGYLTGAIIPTGSDDAPGGGGGPHIPGWVSSIVKGPVNWLKDKIASPLEHFSKTFGDNPYTQIIKAVPTKLLGDVGGAIKDMLPSIPSISGIIGGALDTVGLKDGGILPYNGTMKYDAGGYLPPGLTNVVNLTGKPEPVFTDSQWSNMGGSSGGDGFTYAPTINGSDLTAADLVDDLDFTRRKILREGKYGRSRG